MKKIVFSVLLFIFSQHVFAGDSLYVSFDKKQFSKGDTVNVDCILKYSSREMAAVTLNVWIEDIQKTKLWKYRYPILNGRCSFDLLIQDSLPDGRYAINFLVQPTFFSMKGKVRDYSAKGKGLTYLMLLKNKQSIINTVFPDAKGNFRLGKMAFADTARFIFSAIGKKRGDLYIDLETPLDSAFTSTLSYTEIITVGNPRLIAADTVKPYSFDAKKITGTFTLEGVTVKTLKKKMVEKFDEEYATGLFRGGQIFDGIDGTELESATDVFMFLSERVPGLQIKQSEEGGYNITRRGSHVSVYLDEFKLDNNDPIYINPADVAMIKVFAPMEGPLDSGGGSIAIYTKRGNYVQDNNRKYNFHVKGFSDVETIWK